MKEISDNAKFQVLHTHYKDTFQIIEGAIRQRAKLMRTVLIALVFGTLLAFWPSEFVDVVSQVSAKRFGVSLNPGFFVLGSIVGTIVWFVLLVAVIEYTKKVVYIERQYEYINRVEKELRRQYGSKSVIFTRESGSYDKRKGGFVKQTRFSFTGLFPAILLLILTLNIGSEWLLLFKGKSHLLLLLMNTVIAVYVAVLIVMYMISINKKSS